MESRDTPFGPPANRSFPGISVAVLPLENVPAIRYRGGSRGTFAGRLRRLCRILAIGLLVCSGLIAGLLAFSWARSQGAVSVVESQIASIRVGKLEEAYSLFSSRYRAGVSLGIFRRWLRRQGHLGQVQKLQFWGRSVWGETVVLWGSFQDDLGHNYPVRYLLIRENGSWRIDGFRLSEEIPDRFPETTRFIKT